MQDADAFADTLQKWVEVSMHRSMRHFIGCARGRGLSMPQWGALFLIHRRGGSGVTDLGDDLGVTSSAASQMLERLVQQELVLRSEDPSDRRVKQIVLTDKGLQVIEESMHARQRWVSDLAENLSDEEKGVIITALKLLIDKANQLRQPFEPCK
jgi:MarR family transcriptional regulator, organic hydroperoxide resistance regulator